jgi:hypothetical protein
MTKKMGKSKKQVKDSSIGALAEGLASLDAVWTGSIARLRIYHSVGTVIAYKAPGHNSDAVGDTDDPTIIHALFIARDNGRSITGYTDSNGHINWLDY